MKNYTYVIGDDPYNNVQRWRNKGNGIWSTDAPTLQKALEKIFGSMLFPAELTGRRVFVTGISRDELGSHEVVQVWSTNPKDVRRTEEAKPAWDHWPHVGGDSVGLACEVSVYEIDRYMIPERLLLTEGSSPKPAQSPVGLAVAEYHRSKLPMRMAMQEKHWELAVAKWSMEAKQRDLRLQVRKMEEQIFLADTYLRGSDNILQLTEGTRGTGPYHVFQQRQYLNREIALLANMEDFDCKQLTTLEAWMVKTKAWMKMLPFPRCILVTRLRDKSKDYGCPFTNWILNEQNLVSIVWIRDGENVWRIISDVDFDNAVLSDPHEEQRVTDMVTEHVFKEVYKKTNLDWRGQPVTEEPEGTIVKNATENKYVTYKPITKMPRRFKNIEDWLSSDDYTTKIATTIGEAVTKCLVEVNKKRLVFAIFLQGVVDNTTILDVPKGTSIFDWNTANAFFALHTEYSHGLPDGRARDEWRAFSDRVFLHAGETIIANERHVEIASKRDGRGSRLKFYNVAKMVNGFPMVVFYPHRKHYPYAPVTTPCRVVLTDNVPFIKASMPSDLASRLAEDRDWKEANLSWLPVVAQWQLVQAQWRTCKNDQEIKLNGAEMD